MVHNDIHKCFVENFPKWKNAEWFPNGKDCIRVRLIKTRETFEDVIFMYKSTKEWTIETVDSYISKMRLRNLEGVGHG